MTVLVVIQIGLSFGTRVLDLVGSSSPSPNEIFTEVSSTANP
jgi:hypothetical protein